MAPRIRNALLADPMNTITPSLTPNVSRMFGASVPSAADSSSSNELSRASTTNGNTPPIANASVSDICGSSLPTPGSASSGEHDRVGLSGLGLALLLEVEDRAGETAGSLLDVGVSHPAPRTCRWRDRTD